MLDNITTWLSRLKEKWQTVPFRPDKRISTADLLRLDDAEFLNVWETARASTSDGPKGWTTRGWYHALYAQAFHGARLLEFGPGLGVDAVFFAKHGAQVTCVDVAASNLEVIKRIFQLRGLPPPVCVTLTDWAVLQGLADYDVILALGSLHHAPRAVVQPEFEAIARQLVPGGRLLFHAYPYERWVREGQLPFDRWGEHTDGPGTPWAEWYDLESLLAALAPTRFVALYTATSPTGHMIYFDLQKIDGLPAFAPAHLPAGADLLQQILSPLETKPQWKGATITDNVVTTPVATWAYAAEWRLLRPLTGAGGVRVLGEVLEGRIAVGLLSPDGSEFVVEEEAASGPLAMVLEASDLQEVASIMIRNADRNQHPSRVRIATMDVFVTHDSKSPR